MKNNIKILICGYGDHGKDEVAKRFCAGTDMKFTSSSRFIGEKVVMPLLQEKEGYRDFEECYANRRQHRTTWYNAIKEYNEIEPDKLTKDILKEHSVYVGMRNPLEFEGSKHHFDVKIWVDASKRKPIESDESNGLHSHMFDYFLDNNGTLEDLDIEIDILKRYLDEKY